MISVITVIFLCLYSNKVEAKESYDKNAYENSDEIYINGDINSLFKYNTNYGTIENVIFM